MSDTAPLKIFLSRILPWSDPDEPQTYVGIHWKQQGQHKEFWTGRAVRSVEEAVRTISWADSLPDTRDIYIAMGSQREAEQATSKAGNLYLKPIRNQHNVAALKDLYLDIDIKGGDKGYEDLKSAVAALGQFIKGIDLPKPTMMVGSGGGVHAHWELDNALSPAEWQPLANALAEAARQQGLKCDTQVTVDSARILRPPLTKNWKSDPPKPTTLLGKVVEGAYSVERIERALQPYMKAAPVVPALGQASSKFAGIENTAAANINVGKPVDLDELAPACGFVKEAIDTGGAGFGQPLWNLTTLLATFTDNGREEAHRMASGHPDYSAESTDQLYDRKLREREEKNLGWPSCVAVLNAGCSSCKACPHVTEGKSPASFTPKIQVPKSQTARELPLGYSFNKGGYICFTKIDDMGNASSVPLFDYPISNAWVQKDPWIVHFTAVLHDNVKSKVEIPFSAIAAKDTLVKLLAENGISTEPWLGKTIQEFFMSWVRTLQSRKNAVVESSPYGWNTNQGQVDGFCFGGEVWTPDGSRPSPDADHVLRRQYQPTGDSEYWYDAIKLVTGRGRPELETIVASAFAAPLVKATGWYGSYINAFSQESGIGKTTAMKIAQAVWGNPVTAMQAMDDTINAVTHKIGSIRSLPLYWDEVNRDDAPRKFVKLVFQLTGGKDKSRMGRDASLREVGKWQTMLVSATNESLVPYVAGHTTGTAAGLYRMFEFEVAPKKKLMGDVDTGDAQRMLGKLDDNYGFIGVEYAQWLGQNYSRIDVEIGEYMKLLEKKANVRQDERFWLCTITCLIMGARYATELGFADFDVDEMETFLLKTLDNMRRNIKDSHVDLTDDTNLVNIFTQFLKQMSRHTIWTNRLRIGRGRPKAGDFKILKGATLIDGINVHIGKEDKLIRFSSTRFSEWLDERKISRMVFMREFQKQFNSRETNARLGSGTNMVQSEEYVIEFMAAGTPLASLIDDEMDDADEQTKVA